MQGKRITLIVAGGIAAYKTAELVRLMRAESWAVTPVLTEAGARFVSPLTLSTLAGEAVHDTLWDLNREAEIGHIQMSRQSDLLVVAPATANIMARMAAGLADDLPTTLLLATDKPVLIAPAMNVRMWDHPATRRNRATLEKDGVRFVGPDDGPMACGEFGEGRMSEPAAIVAAIRAMLASPPALPRPGGPAVTPPRPAPLRLPPEAVVTPGQIGGAAAGRQGSQQVGPQTGPLGGRHVLVTSGPTHEPIDPVRYIANRSSGAQGTAIAAALRDLGARVSFVTGPAEVPPPTGVEVIRVTTAAQMRAAVEAALPADAAVMAAAVADWHVTNGTDHKIKKDASGRPPVLEMVENPDILAWVSRQASPRPALVVGFAAETDDVIGHATAKRLRKGCDWIVANDVSPATGIMGGTENAVTVIRAEGAETWPRMAKPEVARRLAHEIAAALLPEDKAPDRTADQTADTAGEGMQGGAKDGSAT